MTPQDISTIIGIAPGLTVSGVLLLIIWFLMAGHLNPRRHLEEWKERAEKWEKIAELHRGALHAITGDMQEMTRAIAALAPALKELAEDHKDAEKQFDAFVRRFETLERECHDRMRRHP